MDMNVPLTREQLEDRLATLHMASLELVRQTTLPALLKRIAELAKEQAGAQYAALGVMDENGGLEQFIPVGMNHTEIAKMDHPPVGLGLIGELARSSKTIRYPDIAKHPKSFGFPPNHPAMKSFLGVPLRIGDILYGQIYLTNKLDAHEFSHFKCPPVSKADRTRPGAHPPH
jgi:GAF domain-containing protein